MGSWKKTSNYPSDSASPPGTRGWLTTRQGRGSSPSRGVCNYLLYYTHHTVHTYTYTYTLHLSTHTQLSLTKLHRTSRNSPPKIIPSANTADTICIKDPRLSVCCRIRLRNKQARSAVVFARNGRCSSTACTLNSLPTPLGTLLGVAECVSPCI